MKTPLIAPSVLSADFAQLGRDVQMINESRADWFHIDVMDGVFVPNISMGFPVIKSIQQHAQKPLDVHLMIVDPDRYIEQFAKHGAAYISVHIEACTHLHRSLQLIRQHQVKPGIAVNPHTPISHLSEVIADAELVCLMSVNPGFGGQKFIENTYRKISELKDLIIQRNSQAMIEIDGGVNADNARKLMDAGADVLVAGNFVFSAVDPKATIELLKNA